MAAMAAITPPHRAAPPLYLDPREVRRQLAIRGMRQDQLARLAGLTPSTVSKACRVGGPLTATSVGRLARALRSVEPDPLALHLLAPSPGPTPEPGEDGNRG